MAAISPETEIHLGLRGVRSAGYFCESERKNG